MRSKMENVFNRKVFSTLLVSSILAVKCGCCQTCQQSLPSRYDPTSDSSTTTSIPGTFYLYPDFFSATQCTGSIVNIQYQFCYMYARTTAAQPAIAFTVFILSDEGSVYRIIDSYTEREDRDVCPTVSNTCCKTVSREVSLTIQRELAIGFVTPAATIGPNNALYRSGTVSSPGFEVSSTSVPSTDIGRTISTASFMGIRQRIRNQRFSVSFANDSSPISTTTTTASPVDTTTSPVDTTTSPIDTTTSPIDTATTPSRVDATTASPMDTTSTSLTSTDDSTTSDSGGNSIPGNRSNNTGAVAGGVIVCLLVLAVATAIAIVIVVLLLWRRQAGEKKIYSGGSEHYEREMQSSVGSVNRKSINLMPIGDTKDDTYTLPDAVHPYEVPYGSEGGSATNSHSTGGYTMQTRQVMTFVPKGQSESTSFQLADEPIYQDPAEHEAALFEQYQKINIKIIQKDQIRMADVVGSGHFGVVFKGEWAAAPGAEGGGNINVAVKTLKAGTAKKDKIKLLQEAAIIGQFSHPNVVKLHGVVIGEQKMIILELLLGGDLYHALLALKPEKGASVNVNLPHTLLNYCRQVASGMRYLALKSFIHRDLAARNVLLSENGVCKIADFGMSRDLVNTNLYISHGGKIPIRWTAPEAIHFHTYSTASDVWSFGCVMYEIWSLGHKPFDSYSKSDCMKFIDEGVRLPPPPGCPKTIYSLMIDCWHPQSSSRPDFVSVVQQLSLPDTKLLKWSEEDKVTDPEAATLGTGLDKAATLYTDLQKQYTRTVSDIPLYK